jgi:hypothetical protein
VHKKLSVLQDTAMPVARHKSAVNTMLSLRDMLLKGAEASQVSKMLLTCAGIVSMKRRIHAVDDECHTKLFKTTQTLIFSLIVLMEARKKDAEPPHCKSPVRDIDDESSKVSEDDDQPEAKRSRRERDDTLLIRAWKSSCLQDCIFENEQAPPPSSWTALLKSDAAVCRAALGEACHMTSENAMDAVDTLSEVFFRASASALSSSMLGGCVSRDGDFLTLDMAAILRDANREKTLSNLADAGESEAGQAVLRDLILSFKLPCDAIGVRRTLLLTREANTRATKEYPEVLNGAHEAAMRGASWSWQEDSDAIHKMCALLSGLALIITKGKDDSRKGSAFNGRICLPFIDAPVQDADKQRLTLLRDSATWVVFSPMPNGKPRVSYSGHGMDGFCDAVLIFLRNIR